MNEIINKEVSQFCNGFIKSSTSINISQKRLDEKLIIYRTDRTKHQFLIALRKAVSHDGATHHCNQSNCKHGDWVNNALFIIDQELETLSGCFSPDQKTSEEFSPSEKVNINKKIDEALEKLQTLGFGQQIIFDEIDELKQHLNLDKKNWMHLFKGKLLDLVTEKVLDKAVIAVLYDTITQSIKADQFVLPQ